MKKHKGFLIDADNRSVTEVESTGDFKEFYELLGCSIVQRVTFTDHGSDDIWLDEEGMYNNPEQVFFSLTKYVPWGIFQRRAVILGYKDGKSADAKVTLEELKEAVEFFNGVTVRAKIALVQAAGWDV
jgi:hypothetical protein